MWGPRTADEGKTEVQLVHDLVPSRRGPPQVQERVYCLLPAGSKAKLFPTTQFAQVWGVLHVEVRLDRDGDAIGSVFRLDAEQTAAVESEGSLTLPPAPAAAPWLAWMFAGAYVAGVLAAWAARQSELRRAAKRAGLCPVCGYDLRASGERCPECGSLVGSRFAATAAATAAAQNHHASCPSAKMLIFFFLTASVALLPAACGRTRATEGTKVAAMPALLPAAAPTPPQPRIAVATLAAKDAAVLEAVLRESLSGMWEERVIFISVGSIQSGWKDPPADFLQRLAGYPFQVRPVSAARFPRPGEKEGPNVLRGIEDPETGKRSWIHWAEIIQWVSDTKVRVDTGVWSGPLGGGGSTDVYELRDGRWVFTGSDGYWRS
jgi:hypothetical protein